MSFHKTSRKLSIFYSNKYIDFKNYMHIIIKMAINPFDLYAKRLDVDHLCKLSGLRRHSACDLRFW